MSSVELRVEVGDGDREVAADRLWALGAVAVVESDAGLSAGFADDATARAARDDLAGRWPAALVIDDGSWRDAWRDGFEPVRAGRVVIHLPDGCPPVTADEVAIVIEPGFTFGSGAHPTTQLALAAVVDRAGPGVALLDVGSGSGVLSVVGARLGARPVHAVDIDDAARAATVANAAANGVDVTVTADLPRWASFDLVVVNLGGAATVLALAASMAGLVAPGGLLVVSGLLDGANDLPSGAFPGLHEVARTRNGQWFAVHLTRP